MTLGQAIRSSDGSLTLPIGCAGAQVGDAVEVELLRPMELIEASWDNERK